MTKAISCLAYNESSEPNDEKIIIIYSRLKNHVDKYFILMLKAIKAEYKEKYINEVLALHFANLLLYYNLPEKSRALTQEIKSNELIEKIYRPIE